MRSMTGMLAALSCVLLLQPLTGNAKSSSSCINKERAAIGRALLEVQSDNWPPVLQ